MSENQLKVFKSLERFIPAFHTVCFLKGFCSFRILLYCFTPIVSFGIYLGFFLRTAYEISFALMILDMIKYHCVSCRHHCIYFMTYGLFMGVYAKITLSAVVFLTLWCKWWGFLKTCIKRTKNLDCTSYRKPFIGRIVRLINDWEIL